jgi:hypothetical protein
VETMQERLLRSGHSEKGQSHGVAPENVVAKSIRGRMPNKCGQAGDGGCDHVLPVGDGRRWDRAYQKVTRDAAGVPRCERQHYHPEDIEPVPHREQGAAEGEHESAAQIEHD